MRDHRPGSGGLASALDRLIHVYQRWVSPALGPHCRYEPTCSSYARQALAQHGAARGLLLAARRVTRCHPWAPGGVDRVPPAASGGTP